MSEAQPVQVKVQNAVAVITINNPPVNAISAPVVDGIAAACDEMESDRSIKAAVITGTGMAFSAGADVKEIAAALKSGDAGEKSQRGIDIFSRVENLPIPIIAAINGLCLGGGLELAMSCHIRICSDRARLGQPEINLGLVPGWGGTQRLPRLIGRGKALRMILTGDPVSAPQALQLGIVDDVVPEAELVRTATGLAQRMASKSRIAASHALRVIREGLGTDLDAGLKLENEAFAQVAASEDAGEGVTAFLEKRQPKFQDK